jgi:hypothetical protein
MSNFSSPLRFSVRFGLLGLATLVLLSSTMFAQTTISTGSIVGTVTDPSGAVVSAASRHDHNYVVWHIRHGRPDSGRICGAS